MSVKRTPIQWARGIYELKAPWFIPAPAQMYTCIAIRSFKELAEDNVDIYTEYYQPYGVAVRDYESDEQNLASIITLRSEDEDIYIHVPDTYILSFPGMDGVPYSDLVLQVLLPKLPEYYDVSPIANDIEQYVTAHVGGTNNTVQVHKFPITEIITPGDSAALETARKAQITDTDNYYMKLQRAEKANEDLQAQVDHLLQICLDNGLIT